MSPISVDYEVPAVYFITARVCSFKTPESVRQMRLVLYDRNRFFSNAYGRKLCVIERFSVKKHYYTWISVMFGQTSPICDVTIFYYNKRVWFL